MTEGETKTEEEVPVLGLLQVQLKIEDNNQKSLLKLQESEGVKKNHERAIREIKPTDLSDATEVVDSLDVFHHNHNLDVNNNLDGEMDIEEQENNAKEEDRNTSERRMDMPNINKTHRIRTPEEDLRHKAGRIVVYGDSNCLDNSHLQKDCMWLLSALLEYSMAAHLAGVFIADSDGNEIIPPKSYKFPKRMGESTLHKHSKVLEQSLGVEQTRPLPPCPPILSSKPIPLNTSSKSANIHVGLKLLSQPEVLSAVLPIEVLPHLPQQDGAQPALGVCKYLIYLY